QCAIELGWIGIAEDRRRVVARQRATQAILGGGRRHLPKPDDQCVAVPEERHATARVELRKVALEAGAGLSDALRHPLLERPTCFDRDALPHETNATRRQRE